MSRQVDVASGGLCERKEFSRRILPLRSAERLMERAPSIYYGLGYAVLLGIVHRMLPWRLATQALDSTVTFLNTTDCRTGRRARQSRPAQIPTSWALCWWIGRRSGGIPAIVGADFAEEDFGAVFRDADSLIGCCSGLGGAGLESHNHTIQRMSKAQSDIPVPYVDSPRL